jgi:alkanesulfonate monooxygenase SsuD/methylene tetrahydromethanopterin reductase-like flavin-dependent oxidoreductase (luciferase family)
MRVGVKVGQWGWGFRDLRESWIAAEEEGFDHLSCFDHVTSSPAGLASWEATSLLTAMAGATDRIGLTVEVLNVSLRHPFLLAGQIAVAQAASGGRVRVGLGAGSFHLARLDHAALGVPFPSHADRLERLAACCRVLPRLWRGEAVDDAALGLSGASLGPIEIEPPRVFVGGTSDALLEIAAKYADGWQAPAELERFPELLARLDTACEAAGRSDPIDRGVQVFVSDVGLAGAADVVARVSELGASSLTFVLNEERGAAWVRRLAGALREADGLASGPRAGR